MKKNIATSVVVTVFALLVFGTNCFGQAKGRVVADIPFDFQVGNQKMKAGKYQFESANPHTNPWLMIVRAVGKSGQAAIMVPTLRSNTVSADAIPGISFNRYESTHYLSSITSPENGVVLRLSRTSEEKQLAKSTREEPRVTIRISESSMR